MRGAAAATTFVSVLAAALWSGSLAFPQTSQSPLDRFTARLLENRYPLSVKGGQFQAAGAQVLQTAIAQSRFVLLGETHGLVQNSELATAVCNSAGPERFKAMAIEEGPLAAAELESFARRRDGLAQLATFTKAFPWALNEYRTREEFEMLEHCAFAAQGEARLWGLNQEGLNGGGLILSRILQSSLGEAARAAMQRLSQKNDDAYRKALQSGSIADLYMLAADDQELSQAAAVLERDGNRDARSLFASLIESHEINRVPPNQYDNARRRERLMKTRFAAAYAQASTTGATPPRVLLKFGAFHIYRGLNPVHGSGIGNYVAEFAEARGVQSLHIVLLPVKSVQPFYPKVGQPAQVQPFSVEQDRRWPSVRLMVTNSLPQGWTLFDLRPLRRDFNALFRAANQDLAEIVFGIDMLVVVPEATPSTDIR